MELIFGSDISYIMIIGFTILGGLMNVFRYIAYHIFIKESKRTKDSKNKYICNIIAMFRNRKNVSNVDNYVDKCMYNLRFCGFKLYTWDKMCSQNIVFVVALASILSILAGYGKRGQEEILLTILIGMLCTAMLIIINMSLSSKAKRNMIYFNLVDYIDENLKPQFRQKDSAKKEGIQKEGIQKEGAQKDSAQKESASKDRAQKDGAKAGNLDNKDVMTKNCRTKIGENKVVDNKNDKVLSINKKKEKMSSGETTDYDKLSHDRNDRDAIKRAFADAIYEAALEKLAGNNNFSSSKNIKEDKSQRQTASENVVIEELIREMFQ
mgnify:CR=1 FL=1